MKSVDQEMSKRAVEKAGSTGKRIGEDFYKVQKSEPEDVKREKSQRWWDVDEFVEDLDLCSVLTGEGGEHQKSECKATHIDTDAKNGE
jgi:hypothetical protein